MKTENFKLKNPVRELIVKDWPAGDQRVTAVFHVETNPWHGERVVRQTINQDGSANQPKKTPYYLSCAIVEGSDGKHYVVAKNNLANILANANLRFYRYFYRADPEDRPIYDQIDTALGIQTDPFKTNKVF